MQISLLNPLLNLFLVQFEAGGVRLQGEAVWLLSGFFGLELTLTGIWFVLRRELDWKQVVQHTLLATALLWAIRNWPNLTSTLVRGFVSAGLRAGGDTVPLADLFNPDALVSLGFEVTAVLFQNLVNASVLSPKGLAMALLEGWVAIFVVLLYFIGGLAVFATLIEFYLSTSFMTILLPWGMFSKTAFLTERAIAHLFASGVRMGFFALLLAGALPVLLKSKLNTATTTPGLTPGILLLLTAATLLFLMWVAHRIAGALAHGSPVLAVADLTRSTHVLQSSVQTLTSALHSIHDALSRTDPHHASRQSSPSRRSVP